MPTRLSLLVVFALLGACDSFDFGRVTGSPKPAVSTPLPSLAPSARVDDEERADPLVVVFAGDVALGGKVRARLGANPLAGIAPILEGPALRIASLAAPLTAKPTPLEGVPVAYAPPEGAEALARAGVDVALVTPARLGADGTLVADTTTNLERASVEVAVDVAGDGEPRPVKLAARGWSIALFSVGTPYDAGRLVPAVRTARGSHDIVLVSQGGPAEGTDVPPGDQLELAKLAVGAGADLVWSRRSRVPRGIGWVSGKPVFYGFGNLVADPDPKDPWTARSFVARVAFHRDGRRVTAVCPYLIEEGAPRLLAGSSRPTEEGIFRRALLRLSEGMGGDALGEPDVHSCFGVAPAQMR